MVNKWRDLRNSKNMTTVLKIVLHTVMPILTQCSPQGNWLSQVWLFMSYVQPLWLYTSICRMYTHMSNPLNQFTTAQEVNFLIINSLFSFLYLSSSITGDIANEKFWKNHRLLLHTRALRHYLRGWWYLVHPFQVCVPMNNQVIPGTR